MSYTVCTYISYHTHKSYFKNNFLKQHLLSTEVGRVEIPGGGRDMLVFWHQDPCSVGVNSVCTCLCAAGCSVCNGCVVCTFMVCAHTCPHLSCAHSLPPVSRPSSGPPCQGAVRGPWFASFSPAQVVLRKPIFLGFVLSHLKKPHARASFPSEASVIDTKAHHTISAQLCASRGLLGASPRKELTH
jgi:hypothetical protein